MDQQTIIHYLNMSPNAALIYLPRHSYDTCLEMMRAAANDAVLPIANIFLFPREFIVDAIHECESMGDITTIDLYITFVELFDYGEIHQKIYDSVRRIAQSKNISSYIHPLQCARYRVAIISMVMRVSAKLRVVPRLLSLAASCDIEYAMSGIYEDCVKNDRTLAKIARKYIRYKFLMPRLGENFIDIGGQTHDLGLIAYSSSYKKFFRSRKNNLHLAKLLLAYSITKGCDIPNISKMTHSVVMKGMLQIENETDQVLEWSNNVIRLYLVLGECGIDGNFIAKRVEMLSQSTSLKFDKRYAHYLAYYLMLAQLTDHQIRANVMKFDRHTLMRAICVPLCHGNAALSRRLYKKYKSLLD